ncbi:MAG: CPBP family intramembrane metalloprotease [Elusimicrobia bacterium]|nr:CPBP family intramembrane metalloprotease [Elusimicrobiota bacterium]
MKFLVLVSSIIFLLACTVFGELLVKRLGRNIGTTLILTCLGVLLSGSFLRVLRGFAERTSTPRPRLGSFWGLGVGLAFGLLASLLSGLAFSWALGHHVDYSQFSDNFGLKALGNIFPAAVEETAFRAGVVHFVSAFFSPSLGLAAGSVPFGVIHFFGMLFGNPATIQHALGVSVAGLLLSLLYLRFGITAAVGCHWLWNTLCGSWVKALELPKSGGVQIFEGAWTTIIVLSALSFALWKTSRPACFSR